MFALIQWIEDKSISVVSVDDVMDSKQEGDTSDVKYGDTSFMAKIIRISEDRKYLSSTNLATDGDIMTKQTRSLPKIINIEKKKSLASIKKKEKAGAAHSTNSDEESVLRMRSIYYDSDSTGNDIDSTERLSESGGLQVTADDGETNASWKKSSQSVQIDSAIADTNKEIEELEKLLAEKVLAKQNLQQREPIRPRDKTKKIRSKREFEHIGVVDNDDNNNKGPANKRKPNVELDSRCLSPPRQQHQLQDTRPGTSSAGLSRVPLNLRNEEAESDTRQQSVGVSQSSCNHQQQRLATGVQRNLRARDIADVEDEADVDNLQLCRQGGAGRVLLVGEFNIWIDKAELMYYQRWIDNPSEMVRRLLKLLVGEKNLAHICARGLSKDPLIEGIPFDILRCVEYYVNKKCNSRIPPSRYNTIVNMMCQTLRHPKRKN